MKQWKNDPNNWWPQQLNTNKTVEKDNGKVQVRRNVVENAMVSSIGYIQRNYPEKQDI